MNTVQFLFQRETESKKVKRKNLCSGSVVYVTAVHNCTKRFIKKYSLFIYLSSCLYSPLQLNLYLLTLTHKLY
jgi:hypothetical protein